MQQQPRTFFQAQPLSIPRHFMATGFIVSATPWNTIGLSGIRGGFFTDSRGEVTMIINAEWPVPSMAVGSKSKMERLHIDRYCTDVLLGTGTPPYTEISAVINDPPDFLGKSAGVQVGIECTQLTAPGRRGPNALFQRIREAVEAEPRERFGNLRGLIVYMWLDLGGEISKPPKKSDHSAVKDIVQALSEYRFDPANAAMPSIELPEKAPDLNIEQTSAGCRFYGIPMMNAVPATHSSPDWRLRLDLHTQLFIRGTKSFKRSTD